MSPSNMTPLHSSASLQRKSVTDMAVSMALGRVSRPRGDGTFDMTTPAGTAQHMATLKEGAAAGPSMTSLG
jgi:hypothetical protein